jgi:hypothetical protein
MIPIGLKNLTVNTIYIKELQVKLLGSSTRFLNPYDFITLAESRSLIDEITAGNVVLVRDNVQLSQADSLSYLADPTESSVLRHRTMNFAQDATLTTLLFKDYTSGDILSAEPINSIQAVAYGTNIRIQRTGGQKILIDGLNVAATYIDAVLVTPPLANAVIQLNALFVNAGGLVGNLPVITSTNTINLLTGNNINHIITGTNIVALEFDISTTGTVPAGAITRPDQDPRRIIGGSTLAVGSWTVYITAYNYFGQVTQTLTIIVSSSFTNTYSFYGGLLTTTKHFLVDSALISQTASPLFKASNSVGVAADAAKAWSVSFWHKSQQVSGYGKGASFGAGYTGHNTVVSGGFDVSIKGGASNTEVNIYYGSNWFRTEMGYNDTTTNMQNWKHVVVSYSGGDTTSAHPTSPFDCFQVYINGSLITRTSDYIKNGGWAWKIAAVDSAGTYAQDYDVRMFTSYWATPYFPSTKVNGDEMGFYNYVLSGADVTTLYNLGVPISLDGALAVNPLDWFRCGDGIDPSNPSNTDLLNFPIMYNFYGSRFTMDAQNMTVADYVSDVP